MIELPRALFDEMLAHARAGMPNEACGVIAGEDGRAVRVYPIRNQKQSPVIYEFDSQEHLQVHKELEGKGWDVLAIFHSHPATEAFPSKTDREQAHWKDALSGQEIPRYPGTKYLILSLMDQEPVLRAFWFDNGEPIEEDVRIT